jgi:transglutaminase-like putative cysteine protease
MHIRYGFDIDVLCSAETPIITLLDVHPTDRRDITQPDNFEARALSDGRPLAIESIYEDGFGNICRRIVAPTGGARLSALGVVHNSGFPEDLPPDLPATRPNDLPAETLPFLLPSRYCEVDVMSDQAWRRFGAIESGYGRVQAVCDYVNAAIRFDYGSARPTRTAAQALEEGAGVCRDFAHSAVTLCRALNIPARYCTGYLGDIGMPPDPYPMDFSAWFEVYIDGRWWTFDARHNIPRIGRIVVARGRDAADVPIIHSFGLHGIGRFSVVTDEVDGSRFPVTPAMRREHHALRESLSDA